MALVKPVIFQVVGYQNSGKTTFITKLITLLKLEGLKIVTIKHHGHGGKPGIMENKDSSQHIEAGSAASLVEGDGRILLQAENKSWTLQKNIQLLRFFEPDVILIEGFKSSTYPKLLLIRSETDKELLTNVSNVKAIIVWNEELERGIADHKDIIPIFNIKDINSLDFIINYIKNQLHVKYS